MKQSDSRFEGTMGVFFMTGRYSFFAPLIFSLIFILMLIPEQAWGVDCSSSDIVLSTQEQVDNFQATYGGGGVCDTVAGNLEVSGNEITNVDGLANLTSVGEHLSIESNAALTNVDGLANLISVGVSMFIWSNTALTNIDGLANLISVGAYFLIDSNTALTNLDGLANLTSVGYILHIESNAVLTDLDGLANLTSVGDWLAIIDNDLTESVRGFSTIGRSMG
jgi:hypothetical protein